MLARLGLLLHLYGLRRADVEALSAEEWWAYRAYADGWFEMQEASLAAQVALVKALTGGAGDG